MSPMRKVRPDIQIRRTPMMLLPSTKILVRSRDDPALDCAIVTRGTNFRLTGRAATGEYDTAHDVKVAAECEPDLEL